jgi:raffinose/stachyose/melibiose transport system permease protein
MSVDRTRTAKEHPHMASLTARRSTSRSPRGPLLLFALPALLVYGVGFALPTIQALITSFYSWEGPGGLPREWVGIDNYRYKLTEDPQFVDSVSVTLRFMIAVVVFQTLIALVYSVKLIKDTKPTIFLRALYFFPTILSSTSVAFIWGFVYDPSEAGLISGVLRSLSISWRPALLASPNTALWCLVFTQVWFHAGQMMVVFVAGLQGIPKDFSEAAAIDGASKWQTFRRVTWPLLGPATGIVVAYTTLQSFRAFDLIYVMTQGGPGDSNATRILSYHIVQTAFGSRYFGEAAAESVMFMAMIAVVTFLQRRVLMAMKADVKGTASA